MQTPGTKMILTFTDRFSATICKMINAKLTFACSNSTIETLEKSVKYVQS